MKQSRFVLSQMFYQIKFIIDLIDDANPLRSLMRSEKSEASKNDSLRGASKRRSPPIDNFFECLIYLILILTL